MANIPIQGTLAPNGPFPIINGDVKIPYHTDQVFIYCSNAGDDTTGDGTQANPYRTPDRARDDIPAVINGRQYYIILLGTAAQPYTFTATAANYARWPGKASAASGKSVARDIDIFSPFPPLSRFGDVNIRAIPELDPTGGMLGTYGVDWTQTHDSATGMMIVNKPAANWPVNGLVGKYICGTPQVSFGSYSEAPSGFIVSNTATSINVAANHVVFNTNDIGIYNLTAIWDRDVADTNSMGTLMVSGGASMTVGGVEFRATGGTIGAGVIVEGNQRVNFDGCKIDGYVAAPGAGAQSGDEAPTVQGCHITTWINLDGSITFNNCLITDVLSFDRFFLGAANVPQIVYYTCWFSRCVPVGSATFTQFYQAAQVWDNVNVAMDGCFIDFPVDPQFGPPYPTGHAVFLLAGNHQISDLHIRDTAGGNGSGIYLGAGANLTLDARIHIESADRYGLEMADGARCNISTPSIFALTGTLGDVKVGNNAPRSLSDFLNTSPKGNETDYDTLTVLQVPNNGIAGTWEPGFAGKVREVAVGALVWDVAAVWSTIASAVSDMAARGEHVNVYLDDTSSPGSTFTIDAAADISTTTFIPLTPGQYTQLTFADPFTFTGHPVLRCVDLTVNISTTSPIYSGNESIDFRFEDCSILNSASPAVHLAEAPVNHTARFIRSRCNAFDFFEFEDDAFLYLFTQGGGQFAASALQLAAGATSAGASLAHDAITTFSGTVTAGISMSLSNGIDGSATYLPYTPAYQGTNGQWWNGVPKNAAGALDQLSVRTRRVRAVFDGTSLTKAVTWSDVGAVYVAPGGAVTDTTGVTISVDLSTVTNTGCTVRSNVLFTGYVIVEVHLQGGVN